MPLKFKGIQKTTLIDYPGQVACTLFTEGCNFRCSYCYNPSLVLCQETGVEVSEEEALSFLERRKTFLDGVCITGGEPLLNPELPSFLTRVKRLGYRIKVDTNGSFPHPLQEIILKGLVDYVAMDIKAPPEKYSQFVRTKVDIDEIERSIRIIQQSGLEYEFRTTVFSSFTLFDFESIGKWLAGSAKYCLQQVKVDLPLLDEFFNSNNRPLTLEEMKKICDVLRPYFKKIEIRN